jgi:hypothetical protein
VPARSAFALLAALLLVPAISTAGQSASRRAAWDRSCLTGILTSYLAALTAHDPSKVATAPGLRVTEDTVEMKLGDGLWRTISPCCGQYCRRFAATARSTPIESRRDARSALPRACLPLPVPGYK